MSSAMDPGKLANFDEFDQRDDPGPRAGDPTTRGGRLVFSGCRGPGCAAPATHGDYCGSWCWHHRAIARSLKTALYPLHQALVAQGHYCAGPVMPVEAMGRAVATFVGLQSYACALCYEGFSRLDADHAGVASAARVNGFLDQTDQAWAAERHGTRTVAFLNRTSLDILLRRPWRGLPAW